MIQALIFDLDDTLYPEKEFARSGFRAVARHIESRYRCSFDLAFSTMMMAFESGGRKEAFPALQLRLPAGLVPLAELVEVYRRHTPEICLFPGYLQLLQELSSRYRLGVITDGLPAVQQRKVRALGIESVMDKIVYTWEYGSDRQKPHPHSFSVMLDSLRVDPQSALYIGDNSDKDCRGAHGVGMKCAEIRHAELEGVSFDSPIREKPDYVLDSLLQLPQVLMNNPGGIYALRRNGNENDGYIGG